MYRQIPIDLFNDASVALNSYDFKSELSVQEQKLK